MKHIWIGKGKKKKRAGAVTVKVDAQMRLWTNLCRCSYPVVQSQAKGCNRPVDPLEHTVSMSHFASGVKIAHIQINVKCQLGAVENDGWTGQTHVAHVTFVYVINNQIATVS